MYAEYWRLKEKPFERGLYTQFAYLGDQHKEGIARLLYATRQHKKCALLTGMAGSGKSFLKQLFVEKLKGTGDFSIAFVDNPSMGIKPLLEEIYFQVSGKDSEISSVGLVWNEIKQLLLSKQSNGYHNLVVVDNAHLISELGVVEQLRMLSEVCDARGNPSVTILFFAQPPFAEMLEISASLIQMVASRWNLSPLSLEQTRDYITRRLSVAGGNGWIFGDDAVSEIYDYSKGIARVINIICDLALYLGMSENAVRVDSGMIKRVVADIKKDMPLDKERMA